MAGKKKRQHVDVEADDRYVVACQLTSSSGASCWGKRYQIVWLIYHCMYDMPSRKWPLPLKCTPWMSLLWRSFHIAIQC